MSVVNYTYDEHGKRSWAFVDVPEDAPNDSKNYVRKGRQWVEPEITGVSGDSSLDGGNASSSFTNVISIDGGAL